MPINDNFVNFSNIKAISNNVTSRTTTKLDASTKKEALKALQTLQNRSQSQGDTKIIFFNVSRKHKQTEETCNIKPIVVEDLSNTFKNSDFLQKICLRIQLFFGFNKEVKELTENLKNEGVDSKEAKYVAKKSFLGELVRVSNAQAAALSKALNKTQQQTQEPEQKPESVSDNV